MKKHLMERASEWGIVIKNWPSFNSCYALIWDADLSGDSQPFHSVKLLEESQSFALRNESNDNMSQPATTGKNPTHDMHETGDNLGGGATPLAPIENATRSTSGEIFSHTGAVGMLPMELYSKNIVVANINWNSSQNPGTIVYSAPISPAGSNIYVQYFSAPYNAWTGGLTWSLVIAATGFNGGKLGLARMPPNFNPSDAHTLADFTVFPYEVLDVKEANATSKVGVDERNVLFHWRNTEPTSIDATGGTFVIFVIAPLVSSGSDVASVNMVIFNKPDQSFRVAQLMPLSTVDDAPGDLLLLEQLFPAGVVTSPYTDTPVTQIVIMPTSTTPILTKNFYGQVQGDGTDFSRPYAYWGRELYNVWDPQYNQTPNATNELNPAGLSRVGHTEDITRPLQLLDPWASGSYDYNSVIVLTQGSFAQMNSFTWPAASAHAIRSTFAFNQASTWAATQAPPAPNQLMMTQFGVEVIPDINDNWGNYAGKTITPPNNESFVLFRTNFGAPFNAGSWNLDSTQTVPMINTLKKHKNILRKGQAAMILVTDNATTLPIAYLKLHFEGYFTAAPQSTILTGNFSDYTFTPVSIVDVTSPIPHTTTMVTNGIMVKANRNAATSAQRRSELIREIAEQTAQLMMNAPINITVPE